MKKLIWLVVIIILIVLAFSFMGKGGNRAEVSEEIVLGGVFPLTGDAASLGENARIAAQLAVDEINEAGGIAGNQLKLIAEDGQCTGTTANNAVNKLLNIDGVHAIVGGLCSAETSAFTAVTEEAQIPVISPCSSAPALTNAGDYFFRNYPSDAYAGVYAANYVVDTHGAKSAAVIYTNDDWGGGLAGAFVDTFTKLGGKVVANEAFEKEARDLRTQITKAKATKPDVVYFVGFTEASIPGIKQMNEIGLTGIPVLGGDAWADEFIWRDTAGISDGFEFIEPATPNNSEFASKMEAAGASVTACAPQAYDAVKIFANVIEEVGLDGAAIKDALYNATLEGASGSVAFDENGDLVGAAYNVRKIQGGSVLPLQ